MSRHKFVKGMTEKAISDIYDDDDYYPEEDYYGEEDPDIFGKYKKNKIFNFEYYCCLVNFLFRIKS